MTLRKRTTYILGAGASFHAGYPFARSMGKELLDWMKAAEHPYVDFGQSAAFLETEYGDDIESLMNGMQKAIRNRTTGYSLIANVYKPAFIEAMRQWFTQIHQRNQAHAYERFATAIVQPGDCVITFNYDVSLDAKLRQAGKWAIGNGYGFIVDGIAGNSPIKLLKLHGSINWLAVLFGGRTGGPSFRIGSAGAFGRRPAFSDADLVSLGYEDAIDPYFPRGGAAAVLPLILPTSRKQFFFETNLGREWESFWTRLWRTARNAIRTSERIVVCGYGLYPIDRRGCNLLLKGECAGKIEVCSGGDTARIVAALKSHGRNAYNAKETFFENWVTANSERSRPQPEE